MANLRFLELENLSIFRNKNLKGEKLGRNSMRNNLFWTEGYLSVSFNYLLNHTGNLLHELGLMYPKELKN